jgi:hypothetical protein
LNVEKFSSKKNFELWNLKMWDLLMQQGLQKELKDKSKKLATMMEWEREWEDLDAKFLSTIRLHLEDEVHIVGEDTTSGL